MMERKTEKAMIDNLYKNTGKSLDQWIHIANTGTNGKHTEVVKLLKDTYGLGTFYADLIVHKARGTDSGSMDEAQLIESQYKGKEHLRSIYEHLITYMSSFGDDLEVAPKNAYVSLRRKKQFACLKPATKKRFEIELILKGQEASGILEAIATEGAMCTHKIKLESIAEITPEVLQWLNLAYNRAV